MQQGSGLAIRGDTRAVRGILLDLKGVVYVRDTLLPSSLDAISRIQAAGIPLKFITNTTRRPRRRIAGDLAGMGLRAALDDICSYRSGLSRPVLRKPSLLGMQASFSRMIY